MIGATIVVKDKDNSARPYEGTSPDQYYRVLAPDAMTVEGTVDPATNMLFVHVIENNEITIHAAASVVRYDQADQRKFRATWASVPRQLNQTIEIIDFPDDDTKLWTLHGVQSYDKQFEPESSLSAPDANRDPIEVLFPIDRALRFLPLIVVVRAYAHLTPLRGLAVLVDANSAPLPNQPAINAQGILRQPGFEILRFDLPSQVAFPAVVVALRDPKNTHKKRVRLEMIP